MSEPIFIIEGENGEYGDRRKEILFADTNEAIAYQRANEIKAETVFFSIWKNGMNISEYMRSGSEWERNCGAVNLKLEVGHKNESPAPSDSNKPEALQMNNEGVICKGLTHNVPPYYKIKRKGK